MFRIEELTQFIAQELNLLIIEQTNTREVTIVPIEVDLFIT
jgi:hypothetical protein